MIDFSSLKLSNAVNTILLILSHITIEFNPINPRCVDFTNSLFNFFTIRKLF